MMPVARNISPPPWMAGDASVAVMGALQGRGDSEKQALFVGGCVRNALLGLPVDDIDIATTLTPAQAAEKLALAGIKVVPTGVAHGTVTAVKGGTNFEITTLRRDVETDGRRAVVAFTTDWTEDAARRDFTMNTLLADEKGNIYDPTGAGIADLEAGRVVFVGDPAQRIAEDYLRILRFFRFYAIYGRGAPDEAALAACREAAGKIGKLSRERITAEFLKILAAPEPVPVLMLMFDNGVLADMPGTAYAPDALARLDALQRRHGAVNVVTRLAVLIDAPEAVEDTLLLSNAQKAAFAAIKEAAAEGGEVKRLVYRHGAEIAAQALLLRAARQDTDADLSLAQSWQPPAFPLTGEDVLAAGLPKGPAIGKILRQAEQWWIDRDFAPDRNECLAAMRAIIEKGPA